MSESSRKRKRDEHSLLDDEFSEDDALLPNVGSGPTWSANRVGSEGWLTESALLPTPAKEIRGVLGRKGLCDLKAVIQKESIRSEGGSGGGGVSGFKSIKDAMGKQQGKNEKKKRELAEQQAVKQEIREEKMKKVEFRKSILLRKSELYEKLQSKGADPMTAHAEMMSLHNEIHGRNIQESQDVMRYRVATGDSSLVQFNRKKDSLDSLECAANPLPQRQSVKPQTVPAVVVAAPNLEGDGSSVSEAQALRDNIRKRLAQLKSKKSVVEHDE